MQGCSVVFHVASPFLVPEKVKDPQEQPALEGARNVLGSVNKTETVERVVLTSSAGAIYRDNAGVLQMENQTLHERYFNESSTIHHNPYSTPRALAEKEARKMAESQSGWGVTVRRG
ncbi:hypothetical protein VTK56DRAFT_9922 [Thermocarpiscus australiensis]